MSTLIYKKAGLHYCCSAVRALVLPNHPNKQHCSPRRMYFYSTHLRACIFMKIHTYGHLVLQCLG